MILKEETKHIRGLIITSYFASEQAQHCFRRSGWTFSSTDVSSQRILVRRPFSLYQFSSETSTVPFKAMQPLPFGGAIQYI